jgi:hypothetical protein
VLEQAFGASVASVGYVGSRTDRGVGSALGAPGANYNLAPAAPGNVQTRRPFFGDFPGVTNINVRESRFRQWYDALQLVFQRRYQAGLSLATHYTFAHGEWESWAPWDISIVERFTAPLDIRHKYVFQATYELPRPSGGGIVGHVLGGWQVNASAFWQSGLPFDVTNAVARTNTGGTDRPNLIADPGLPADERTLNRYFNTAAFAPQAQFTAGNAPRAVLRGPAQRRLDMSLFRDVGLGGFRKLQLRAEVYNVTNTPSFNVPGGALGTPAFGRITSVGNSIARQMQFGARLTF